MKWKDHHNNETKLFENYTNLNNYTCIEIIKSKHNNEFLSIRKLLNSFDLITIKISKGKNIWLDFLDFSYEH